jgi:glutamate racemase
MIKIGFFDSGHGGLGVLRASLELLSGVDYYYIGDSAFHPYGEKSDDEIIKRSRTLTKILIDKGCLFIVVACNSATAVAIDQLRDDFPDITFIGIEPYLNILTKKTFLDDDKIGALVTKRTYNSGRLKKLKERVDPDNRLEIEYVNDLASFVERIITKKEAIDYDELKNILKPVLGKKWDYVILGCTHYPLILKELEGLFSARCLDPASYVARQIKELLLKSNLYKPEVEFCVEPFSVAFNYMDTDLNTWSQNKLGDFLWWNS